MEVLKQAGKIIEGHYNEFMNHHLNLSEQRMDICKKCPIFLNRFGGICNNKLWFSPKTGDVSLRKIDEYIQGCGCRLKAKTTLVDESCPAGKW